MLVLVRLCRSGHCGYSQVLPAMYIMDFGILLPPQHLPTDHDLLSLPLLEGLQEITLRDADTSRGSIAIRTCNKSSLLRSRRHTYIHNRQQWLT